MFFLYLLTINLYFCNSQQRFRKVAVVTGGNKGIGYTTTHLLSEKFDGDVYLTAKNGTLGHEAVISLHEFKCDTKFHLLDITDRENIEDLKIFLERNYGGLDVLVNNAAVKYEANATEPFSVQAKETIKVNYFGLRDVCNILYPIIKPHARIVHISCAVGHLSTIPGKALRERLASESLTEEELDNLMKSFVKAVEENRHEEEGWPSDAFAVSKVAITKLAFIHQRQFFLRKDLPDVIVNAVHPGNVHPPMLYIAAMAPVYAATLITELYPPKGKFLWYDSVPVDWENGPVRQSEPPIPSLDNDTSMAYDMSNST